MTQQDVKKLRIVTAEGCAPCAEVKQQIDVGNFVVDGLPDGEEVDLTFHDIAQEEDFPLIEKYGLEKVPAALLEEEKCNIDLDVEQGAVIISCPSLSQKDLQPSS